MFPKTIITIWLNDTEPFPDYLAECLRTQQSVPGWSHKLLTLDDVPKDNTYLAKAIKERKWTKAADYFRVWYLNQHGGVYLDADIEIRDDGLFDHLLSTYLSNRQPTKLITQLQENGWIQNAFLMSYPDQPVFKEFMKYVECIPDAVDDTFAHGVAAWSHIVYKHQPKGAIYTVPEHMYLNGHLLYHYGNYSWVKLNIDYPVRKVIVTIWLNEESIPSQVQQWIATHQIPGWQHYLITLDNYDKTHPLVNEAIKAKKWVTASDYLRMIELYSYGGVYLDADIEVKDHKVFDYLVNDVLINPNKPTNTASLVVEEHDNRWVANGFVVVLPHHPVLAQYLVRSHAPLPPFTTVRDEVWTKGMGTWTDAVRRAAINDTSITIYPKHYFIDSQWMKHYGMNSWVPQNEKHL